MLELIVRRVVLVVELVVVCVLNHRVEKVEVMQLEITLWKIRHLPWNVWFFCDLRCLSEVIELTRAEKTKIRYVCYLSSLGARACLSA